MSKTKKVKNKQPYSKFSPIFLICTILGIGKIPVMPGTFGSLFAVFEFSFYVQYITSVTSYIIYLIVIFPIILLCIQSYCSTTGKTDPQEVVIDEYYGQYIAQLFCYIICYKILQNNVMLYLAIFVSFAFFRLFDISKISLVGYCERNIKGALGVLLDDVVAGFFAAISASVLLYIIHYMYF